MRGGVRVRWWGYPTHVAIEGQANRGPLDTGDQTIHMGLILRVTRSLTGQGKAY